jgi:hypothetical protein
VIIELGFVSLYFGTELQLMVHHHTFFTKTSDQEVRYTISSHSRGFCAWELTTKLGYFCHIIVVVDINMKDRLVGWFMKRLEYYAWYGCLLLSKCPMQVTDWFSSEHTCMFIRSNVTYQLSLHGTWLFALGACMTYIHFTSRFLQGLRLLESFDTGIGSSAHHVSVAVPWRKHQRWLLLSDISKGTSC